MSEPIISVSGLRGIIGDQFTPFVAVKYVSAFCSSLPVGPVVLARDGRSTGTMLMDAVRATLVGHGHSVLDAGVAATPTVGVLVRERKAVGGIQISASHNPPAYNGLKLFGNAGRVLPSKDGVSVLQAYREGRAAWTSYDKLGAVQTLADPHAEHERLVLNIVDVPKIRAKSFRVFLDSNHGAGSLLGRRVLEKLGCQTQIGGDSPDGQFSHPPEPLAENLLDVSRQVAKSGCDVGFCQDPDADRLAVLDETGKYIGEECTVALCLMQILSERRGPIVTNCATSCMNRILAEQSGVAFAHSKVGEANVVDLMLELNAIFGGEGNGGPIDPRVGLVRDSFVGMALILALMKRTGKSISQLVSDLPKRSMIKSKMEMSASDLQQRVDRLYQRLQANEVSHLDGLKLSWPDRWILLRASNTEPIVRLIAEAPTEAEATALIADAKAAMG
jgi:phosphomannomutase